MKTKGRIYALSISMMAMELQGLPRGPPSQLQSPAPAEPALASVREQHTPASLYLPTLVRPFKAKTAGRWLCPGILCHSKLCCHVDKSICPTWGSSLPVSLQVGRKMYSVPVQVIPLDTDPFLSYSYLESNPMFTLSQPPFLWLHSLLWFTVVIHLCPSELSLESSNLVPS